MKKYYKLNFLKNYIEVEIINIPNDDFNKNKFYYDIVLCFEWNNIIIRYKSFIINNKNELEKLIFYNILIRKIYITTI